MKLNLLLIILFRFLFQFHSVEQLMKAVIRVRSFSTLYCLCCERENKSDFQNRNMSNSYWKSRMVIFLSFLTLKYYLIDLRKVNFMSFFTLAPLTNYYLITQRYIDNLFQAKSNFH